HTYAVGVCGGGKGNCQGICSGTLITPNLVVTARHCVDNTPQEILCELNPSFGSREWSISQQELWITTNATMNNSASGWHVVNQIVTPTDGHICGNDIALLVLNGLVAAAEAKP